LNASYLELPEFYRFLTARQKLPKYLQNLLSLTPSGEKKLIDDWGGLTNESQIQILECLSIIGAAVMPKVYYQALESGIPYIRYLAARQLDYLPEYDFPEKPKLSNEEIKELYDSLVEDGKKEDLPIDHTLEEFQAAYRINTDPSKLVGGASYESATPNIRQHVNFGLSIEKFFNLSQDDRLAAVRDWDFGLFEREHVKNLSELISHGIENNLATDEDLCEIISDALAYGQKFGNLNDEGLMDVPLYSKYRAEIYDPLWKLVPTIVKKRDFFDLSGTLACTIPMISNSAFHNLLLSTSNHKFFDFIIDRWKALRIAHYEAFADYFHEGLESSCGRSKERLASFCQGRIEFRYSILSTESKNIELRELKIYRLAKELASFGNIPKKLSELKGKVIPGQIFKTFLNLENMNLPSRLKLPIIEELEGDLEYLPYKQPTIDKMISDTKDELERTLDCILKDVVNLSDKLSEIETENAERQEIETRNTETLRLNYKAFEKIFYVGFAIIVFFFIVVLWRVW